jgi:hypothetical protein
MEGDAKRKWVKLWVGASSLGAGLPFELELHAWGFCDLVLS